MMAGLIVVPCACVDTREDDEPQYDTPAELFCSGLCRAEERCGRQTAHDGCVDACVGVRPGLASYSTRGAELVGDCVARFDCTTLVDAAAWDARFNACWEQAQLEVEPRPSVRAFCADYSRAYFECGYWFSTEDCESIYGMWADWVLERMTGCESQPTCEQQEACVDTVFQNL
jgi:hypothetical protein